MVLSRFIRRAAAVALMAASSLLTPFAQAAVVLQVNGSGILTGASGITVGALPGTYSVQFVDGTCAAVFGACDAAHFAFTSLTDAASASQALLDLVFVDSGSGQFDTRPDLTRGCTVPAVCDALTPYSADSTKIDTKVAENGTFDGVGLISLSPTSLDLSVADVFVWAVWSLDSATHSVPEPSSLALVGLAGLALSWAQRRRRPAAQTA